MSLLKYEEIFDRPIMIGISPKMLIMKKMSKLIPAVFLVLIESLVTHAQNENATNLSEVNDLVPLQTLSSGDKLTSTKAAVEIFNRGERMIPLLLKMKGDRSISRAYCIGDPLAAMGTRVPSEDATQKDITAGIKAGWYVTVEIVSLYLISAIYYENLSFAQVPYLTGNKRVTEMRYNTPKRIKKAWYETEKWIAISNDVGMVKARESNLFPLKSSKIHFYGTEPSIDRSLSDCLGL